MLKRLKHLIWVASVGISVLGIACQAEHGNEQEGVTTGEQALVSSTTKTLTFSLPAGTAIEDAPAGASGRLILADGARVEGPTGILAALSNAGPLTATSTTELGVAAQSGSIASRPKVVLRNRARVQGDIQSGQTIQRGDQSVVTGSSQANSAPGFARWTWTVTLPAASQAVSVAPDTTRTIAPGAFDVVTVYSRATLRLQAGTYYFTNLTLEQQANLAVDTTLGPVIVYVRSALTWRGRAVITGSTDRLLVVYAGSSAVALESPFDATLVAPEASVRLAVGGATHTGAVFAKDLQLDPNVRLKQRSFSAWEQVPFTCHEEAGKDPCGTRTGCVGQTCDATLSLPAGVQPFEAAIVANGSLVLGANAKVLGAATNTPPLLFNGGTTRTEVGSGAIAGSIWSRAPVTLSAGSTTRGYLATASTLNRNALASVFGEIKLGAAFANDVSNWTVKLAKGTTDRLITSSTTLTPGAYHNLVVKTGQTLDLSPGRYDLESLIVEAGGALRASSSVFVNVRTGLKLEGQVTRAGSLGNTELFLSYFGTHAVDIRDLFDGSLFVPHAPVKIGDGRTFRGAVAAGDISVGVGGIFEYEPPAEHVDNGSGVTLFGNLPNPETSREAPVEVFVDNPDLTGAFVFEPEISATKEGTYSHKFTWFGVNDTYLSALTFSGDEDDALLSLFAPLPYDGSPLPHNPGFPTTAKFRYRGSQLIHGNVYAFDAQMRVDGVGLRERKTLWARLSSSVSVVPIVVVAYQHTSGGAPAAEVIAKELVALFDFLPTLPTAPAVASGDYTPPDRFINGMRQEPPDEIWAKCLVQFRVLKVVLIPQPVIPGGAPCFDGGHNLTTSEDQLHSLIAAAAPDDAAAWFGPEGLDPLIVEAGPMPVCNNSFSGNTIASSQTVELNTSAFGSQDATTVAHELGHALSLAHPPGLSPGNGNLMTGNGQSSDRDLNDAQCNSAASIARGFSKRLFTYDRDAGRIDASQPFDDYPPEIMVPVRTPGTRVCCSLDDHYSQLSRLLCSYAGGTQSAAENCKVCCAQTDPLRGDEGSVFIINRVDPATCDEDRVLEAEECSEVCCVRGSTGKRQSSYACVANDAELGIVAGRISTDEAEIDELCPRRPPE